MTILPHEVVRTIVHGKRRVTWVRPKMTSTYCLHLQDVRATTRCKQLPATVLTIFVKIIGNDNKLRQSFWSDEKLRKLLLSERWIIEYNVRNNNGACDNGSMSTATINYYESSATDNKLFYLFFHWHSSPVRRTKTLENLEKKLKYYNEICHSRIENSVHPRRGETHST